MFHIYWLINEDGNKTYVGFSDNISERLKQHSNGQVNTTKNFGKLRCYILEEVEILKDARSREKHWKSSAGRRKLRELFKKI